MESSFFRQIHFLAVSLKVDCLRGWEDDIGSYAHIAHVNFKQLPVVKR